MTLLHEIQDWRFPNGAVSIHGGVRAGTRRAVPGDRSPLPELVTEGDTMDEARAMAKDAIRGYIESLVKRGEEIPVEPHPATVERVAVTI